MWRERQTERDRDIQRETERETERQQRERQRQRERDTHTQRERERVNLFPTPAGFGGLREELRRKVFAPRQELPLCVVRGRVHHPQPALAEALSLPPRLAEPAVAELIRSVYRVVEVQVDI